MASDTLKRKWDGDHREEYSEFNSVKIARLHSFLAPGTIVEGLAEMEALTSDLYGDDDDDSISENSEGSSGNNHGDESSSEYINSASAEST